MRLVMAGLDCNTADMETRERFVLPADGLPGALSRVREDGAVDGCVLIVTCNRSELYISYGGDVAPDAPALLCRALGLDAGEDARRLAERHEGQVAMHLLRVASGLESSVLGDDQILTQVRAAAEAAREHQAIDPVLETLFRSAVTAGKRVKTSVAFVRAGSSVAGEAVRAVAAALGGLAGRRALVIGNGDTGRLAAEVLHAKGAAVAVTVRNARRPPDGCDGVPFDDRYAAMDGCDVVVSATTSPHHTVSAAAVAALDNAPRFFADLAVPRDIDPAVGRLERTTLWNVDDFRQPGGVDENDGPLRAAQDILDEEARRFTLWRRSRARQTRVLGGIPDFPVFINLHGATVLMAGGGKVAARRTGVLLGFGAKVRVVSPALSPEMEKLVGRDGLTWERRGYDAGDLDGVTLAVAATDSRDANRRIGHDARERGILVSVADKRDECTFYFPAVVRSDNFTAGLISQHGEHALVKRAAARIGQELERFDEEHHTRRQ